MDKSLLHALKGHKTSRIPFWFMRQAGRSLPEYRALRQNVPDFLSLCYNPQLAAEVTLQPIRRFDMDGAILFSDILVIPDALGMHVSFVKGEGPKLNKLKHIDDLKNLSLDKIEEHLYPITQTIKLTKSELPNHTALIGFAGAPWTVACYMLQGKGGNFDEALRLLDSDEVFVDNVISLIIEATIRYILMQIKAGAEAIQLFDSWAGLVPDAHFERAILKPNQKIIAAIKEKYPNIPIIGFAKSIQDRFGKYAEYTQANGLGVSMDMELKTAMQFRQPHQALQGNLDPVLLADDLPKALIQAQKVIDETRDIPFIFNLGHGMLPHTPVAHIEALCDLIKNQKHG
jgi:uroporphyrinogen decarboxylase